MAAIAAWLLLRSEPDGNDPVLADPRPAPADERRQPLMLVGRAQEPASTPKASASTPKQELGTVPAKAYTIEGIVKDIATEAPVLGAEVIAWFGPRRVMRKVHGEVLEGGRFRIEVEGPPTPPVHRFELVEEGWQVVSAADQRSGRTQGAGARVQKALDSASADRDGVDRPTLWVRRTFRLRGIVQDVYDRPLPDVEIKFFVLHTRGTSKASVVGMRVSSGPDGHFDIGHFGVQPRIDTLDGAPPPAYATFSHPGFAPLRLDPLAVPGHQRDSVVVTMTGGVTLAGTLVGPDGKPLADAPVVVEYSDAPELVRGVRTDNGGHWRLECLNVGKATLSARLFAQDLRARRDIDLAADELDVRLVADAIRLERFHPTTSVLGLALAEVDDELREAYEVPKDAKVVILDPGPDFERLGIGALEKGCGIWIIGQQPVTSLQALVERLIEEATASGVEGRVRIVYTFGNERMAGTNTQQLSLTAEQIAELKALRDRLAK